MGAAARRPLGAEAPSLLPRAVVPAGSVWAGRQVTFQAELPSVCDWEVLCPQQGQSLVRDRDWGPFGYVGGWMPWAQLVLQAFLPSAPSWRNCPGLGAGPGWLSAEDLYPPSPEPLSPSCSFSFQHFPRPDLRTVPRLQGPEADHPALLPTRV